MSEQLRQWVTTESAYTDAERLARLRAARAAGSIVVNHEVAVNPVLNDNNTSTLLYATQMAKLGDEASMSVVVASAATDVAERLFKAKHQTKVKLNYASGALHQNGRKLTDIQANTLRYSILNPIMERRSGLEHKNAYLFDDLVGQGLLETYDALVWSQATNDKKTKRDYNFFEDTDTCSVQLLTKDSNDDIYLQTALVAGKKSPNAKRHDSTAIMQVAAANGIEIVIDDVDDTAGTVMLIPKGTISGIHDVVEWYDDAAGGTFYGLNEPRQDYAAYAELCYQRDFTEIVSSVTAQLLAEAHMYTSPMEVIERLDYWSERFCVKESITNEAINQAVFGPVAAQHIIDARWHLEQGDVVSAQTSMREAQETAVSGSCPLFKGSIFENGSKNGGSDEEGSGNKFMNCPDCNARVYDDPCAKYLKCGDCNAFLLFGQKFNGNGGSKKQKESKKPKPSNDHKQSKEHVVHTAEKPITLAPQAQPVGSVAVKNAELAVAA